MAVHRTLFRWLRGRGGIRAKYTLAEGASLMGAALPLWTVLPFVALLLSIAVLPLCAGHWWEHNRNKAIVAAALSLPVVIYLLAVHGSHGGHELREKLQE